ncbi:MAG: GDSL-type esterase/lipase family protein [Armatimonadota bacterium]
MRTIHINYIKRGLQLCIGLVMVVHLGMSVCAEPLLKPGQRMVFLGDYITEHNMYTRYVANAFTLRYPGAAFSFRNLERRGDTVQAGNARLAHDVLSLKPDVVVVLCTNYEIKTVPFVSFWPFTSATVGPYIAGIRSLVHELNKDGIKVVLITPPCMELNKNWRFKGDYNTDIVAGLADAVKKIVADEKLPCVDIYTQMLDVMTRMKADDSSYTFIPWGNEPSHAAQAVMAFAVLKGLGFNDQPASLTLSVRFGRMSAVKCTVNNLQISDKKVSFSRTDAALPTYLDPEADKMKAYLPFTKELNNYPLTVSGLSEGRWRLTVQGIEVGVFTTDELAAGVNLADKPGPWAEMGKKINAITKLQDDIANNNWRIYTQQVSCSDFPGATIEKTRQSVDALIDTFEQARIKATSQRTWNWLLEKQ